MLQVINGRFGLLNGMNLDYSHFRNVSFQSKNKNGMAYDDCLERNKEIRLKMLDYEKRHCVFKSRKDLKRRKSLRERKNIRTEEVESCTQMEVIKAPKESLNRTFKSVLFTINKGKNRSNIENVMFNPESQFSIENTLTNLGHYKSNLKEIRKEKKNKNTLEMKSVVMSGNYFDDTSQTQ